MVSHQKQTYQYTKRELKTIVDKCQQLRTDYLPNRNITLRMFATMTTIGRRRLETILDGLVAPSREELAQITEAIARHELKLQAHRKPVSQE